MRRPRPILLFDGECGVCRRIAAWVTRGSHRRPGEPTLDVTPIGDDPEALHALAPDLDIWEAYATIHVVMPDGSLRRGGEAVAEVLRRLPATRWFSWIFGAGAFGVRPFQVLLNVAYTVLADVRPLFGCESCGTSSAWVKAVRALLHRVRRGASAPRPQAARLNFTARPRVTR